jgi:hypothetical protein
MDQTACPCTMTFSDLLCLLLYFNPSAIQKALDNKRFALGIFLDLSKAFDVINHNLLLAKLALYGLRGKIHVWMSSYLTDRTQFVEIQHVDQKTSRL